MQPLAKALSELPEGFIHDIVIVDDGSTDRSAEELYKLLAANSTPSKLITKENGGKGTAIVAGIPECSGTHMVIFDADLELDVSDLISLFQPVLENRSEVVFGVRNFMSQSSFTYRYVMGNKFLSHYYGFLFNHYLSDIMCGSKLLPLSLWQKLDLKLHGFTTEAEIAAKVWSEGFKPWEVVVNYSPRTREEGKGITVLDAIKIIILLVSLRVRLRKKK